MVERRLPKPKVAGSNPVFRSKETPPEPQTAAPCQRSFLFHLTHRSGKRGSPQDLLLPPVEGRGGYKKARNTRADFESHRTKNQCEFEPRFPLKGNSPRTTDRSTPARGLFLFHLTHRSGKRGSPQDLLLPPVEGRGGYKKARNTRADFESLRTKNQCEFEPRFPLIGNSPRATDRSTLPAVFFYSTSRCPYTSFPTFTAAGRDILIFCVSSLREIQGAECNNRHCPPLAIDN